MRYIPTTLTAVDRLRRDAKRLTNSTLSLRAAQDFVARNAGYESWKHVTVCVSGALHTLPSAESGNPEIGSSPAPSQSERLLAELFDVEALHALLDGGLVAMYNADSGRVFGERLDGSKVDIDRSVNVQVTARLASLMESLNKSPPFLDADVDFNGCLLCLTMVLPPVAIQATWTIAARSVIPQGAVQPLSVRYKR